MFASREQAGKLLGEELRYLAPEKPVVLGITRGGVAVAAQVAKVLKAPLYPLVVKKISSVWNPEFAVGAMGPDGGIVGDLKEIGKEQIRDKKREIREKIKEFGARGLGAKIKNKTLIIVDDGVATGWTVRAAVAYAKSKVKKASRSFGAQKSKIIVATPVASREAVEELRKEAGPPSSSLGEAGDFVVLEEADELGAVGNYYEDFGQVNDEEVKRLLGVG